jgi:PPIC-type PPIASE domain
MMSSCRLSRGKTVRVYNFSIGLLCVAGLIGCQKPQQPRTPVARIDNETLTLEEIKSRFDSSRGISPAQVHEYIQHWLTNELLYQEAVRQGLDQTDALEARLADIRRQLAINALLDREIYTNQSQESAEEEIHNYFEQHRSEFTLTKDIALISLMLFKERDPANSFRTKVMRGASWNETRDQLLSDPQQRISVITHVDSAYYSESTLFPPELWRVVSSASKQEPSFPVRTDDGYYVVMIWKFTRRGDVPELAYVRDEIKSRLAISRRQVAMDRLLENLRSKHVVQILVSSVPQDSLSLKNQE